MRREARVPADLAEYDVRRPLVATLDADHVLDSFHSARPSAPDGGLDDVAREHHRGGRRTVEIEPSTLQGRQPTYLTAPELYRLSRRVGQRRRHYDRSFTRGIFHVPFS